MVGDCCTASNLPLFPLLYYRHDKGSQEPEKDLKRGWYPFVINYMRYTTSSSSAWCISILLILLRIVWVKASSWAVDVLWPFFHIAKSERKGTEGWVFTFRLLPLIWLYVSERRVLIAIAPCIIFYKTRTVLHVFPLLSVVSSHKKSERRFFMSVLYLFYYRTIHTPSASMANNLSVYRAVVLFPVFWHFYESGSHVTTLSGVVWFAKTGSERFFVLFPLVWIFTSSSNLRICVIIFLVKKTQQGLEKLVLFPFFSYSKGDNTTTVSVLLLYWLRTGHQKVFTTLFPFFSYSKGDNTATVSVLLLYWLRTGHQKVFTTLFPFFFFYRDTASNATSLGVFYLVWFTKDPANSSATVAVLPFFHHQSREWKRIVGCLLFWLAQKRSGMWWVTVFPFFFLKRDGNITTCWLFPIFFYRSDLNQSRSKRTLGVLFLFWLHRRSGGVAVNNETTALLLPFVFFHRHGDEVYTFILPFWFSRSSNSWSMGVVPFIIVARSGGSTTISLFLIFWLHLDGDSYLFALFPFIWVAGSSNSFLFFFVPFFWFYTHSSGSFLFLFPFFLLSTASSSFHLAVFPLFHISRTSGSQFYSLFYLFWWWKYGQKWSLCCIDAFWLN